MKDLSFCPNLLKDEGYCYDPDEREIPYSVCSSSLRQETSDLLERWTCPNEANCGDKWEYIVDRLEKTLIQSYSLEIGGKTSMMLKPDSCGYKISPPSKAKEYDLLKFKVWKETDSNVYFTYGTEFSPAKTTTVKGEKGKTVTIEAKNTIWITATATSTWKHGSFVVEFWFVD